MTNREVLNKMCIYDLLCRIQDNLNSKGQCGMNCIIDCITGDIHISDFGDHYHDCFTCIEHWLNKECNWR